MSATTTVLERRHSLYEGQVQGVGFRYTTRAVSRSFDVVGYVRNLPNGSVEVLAEGSGEQLDKFHEELANRMSGHVEHVSHDRRTATDEFANFDIRY